MNVMSHARVSFKLRSMMFAVAIAALCFGAERMWRRRQFYLEQAAPHAHMEAFYSDLALDLAGVRRRPPYQIVDFLLPDGTGVEVDARGPSPRIYYPLGTKNLADDATVTRLIAMCNQEAARERAKRRKFERMAAPPGYFPAPHRFPIEPHPSIC